MTYNVLSGTLSLYTTTTTLSCGTTSPTVVVITLFCAVSTKYKS